jgi:threonine/homoserine/homoserine lactone efflux protein
VTAGLLLASAVSAAAYTLTPGPGFLAVLGLGAGSGRRAGGLFLAGHFVGDVVWASLSLVAIIGARSIGSLVFDVLGLACGVYLCALGWRAATIRRDAVAAGSAMADRALLHGLAFGLSNPKAYPVAIAMFTALLAGHAEALDWSAFAPLLAAACAGFLLADMALIALVGAAMVRRLYARHALLVTRASGVLFLGFGLQAIASAAPALLVRRG